MTLPKTAATILFCLTAFSVQAETLDPGRIISAATGDWDKDGSPDLAMLVEPAASNNEEDHAVYIFLKGETNRLHVKTVAPNKIWGNLETFGQEPSIAALPNGSILITSHNDAIGRDRWEQKLTIAYRNFDFVVAGYTYTSYDTLDPDNSFDCDLNVLTGKGESNGNPVATTGEIVLLTDWSDERGQSACGRP
ncbi:hypothetical protein [Pararhizobium gei]|uniref:hypothetical protein n=1 Tax=Pararhizobium gei TaxID=1395951 RepID=UPI0023DC8317|nr:hypothetical protein [Rhizobium gei]